MIYYVSVVTDNSAYTTIIDTKEEAERYADEVREKAQTDVVIKAEYLENDKQIKF